MDAATIDVAVIGGGAAGLSAALVLGRARRRVVVIDAGAPRNAPAAHMQGFLSRDGMSPADLLSAGARRRSRLRSRDHRGRGRRDRGGFHAPACWRRLRYGPTASACDRRRRSSFPTFPAHESAGAATSSIALTATAGRCATRRSASSGPIGSIDHAQLLRQWSDDIVFFSHSHSLTADERAALDARGIGVIEGTVAALSVADDRLNGVELSDGRVVPRAAVFMRPSLRPQGEALIESLGCQVGEDGSCGGMPLVRRASPASGSPGTPATRGRR